MPPNPTPPYARGLEAVTDLQDAAAAQAAQQNNVIYDPTTQTGDPTNGFAVYVQGWLGGITPFQTYGIAVWMGPASTGAWMQVGGTFGGGFESGDIKWSVRTSPSPGWLKLDGSTITGGVALYPGLAAAQPSLVSGADLVLPDARGRSPVAPDPTGVHMPVNTPALGASGGEETHVLSVGELANHSHNVFYGTFGAVGSATNEVLGSGSTTPTTAVGSSQAHNTMHPWLAMNCFIKT